MRIVGKYKNGNYYVTMLEDGTKIRANRLDSLVPDFAENCDMLITTKCDGGCPYCYEGCSLAGEHADLMNLPFLDTLHPYTELAINGNDLTHPQLVPFMEKMREKKIFLNMTVNQKHFEKNLETLYEWSRKGLIYGLGISLNEVTEDFCRDIAGFPNAVIHVINGIVTMEDLFNLSNWTDKQAKVLILGYKDLGRGQEYNKSHNEKIKETQDNLRCGLDWVLHSFKVVSFDNLALEQLNVRQLVSDEDWAVNYMGADSEFTFYIDAVNKTFAKNSIAERKDRYPLMDNIDNMFNKIRLRKKG